MLKIQQKIMFRNIYNILVANSFKKFTKRSIILLMIKRKKKELKEKIT